MFLLHVQALKIIQTEAQQQILCYQGVILAHFLLFGMGQQLILRITITPFLLFGRRQQLASSISIGNRRRGVSDKMEDPADQTGPEGCILNHAGLESPKFICVSLTASTDCALSQASVRSFWRSLFISGHKDSYSILSLCANLFAIGHCSQQDYTTLPGQPQTLGNITKEIVITQELHTQFVAFGVISPYQKQTETSMNRLKNYIELVILTVLASLIFPWLPHLLSQHFILKQRSSGQSMGLVNQQFNCTLSTSPYVL